MRIKYSVLSAPLTALFLAMSWWVWSFTQTDPNLYYSSNSIWVRFQQMMWQVPRQTVVWWYVGMIVAAFCWYIWFLKTIHSTPWNTRVLRMTITLFALCCWLLAISNNALSHDIYNYMFNAKAVTVYHQDPHIRSALEIAPHDEWVRFMHNVHTTAPYGRMWTYITLIPYYLGLGKFITTYVAFKAFMAVGFGLLTWIQWSMLKEKSKMLLFILNPLVILETFSSGHNDVWMMVFASASFALLFRAKKAFSVLTFISVCLLVLSTQIKEATLVLVPLWGFLALKETNLSLRPSAERSGQAVLRMTKDYWAEIATLLLFIPLLTARSQQFNPWYLIWPLTFLPFIRVKAVRVGLIVFSLTSLLRYVPFLFVGEYSDAIQLQMKMITWSAVPLSGMLLLVMRKMKKNV